MHWNKVHRAKTKWSCLRRGWSQKTFRCKWFVNRKHPSGLSAWTAGVRLTLRARYIICDRLILFQLVKFETEFQWKNEQLSISWHFFYPYFIWRSIYLALIRLEIFDQRWHIFQMKQDLKILSKWNFCRMQSIWRKKYLEFVNEEQHFLTLQI